MISDYFLDNTKPLHKITVYVEIKTFIVFGYEWCFRKKFFSFAKHRETPHFLH